MNAMTAQPDGGDAYHVMLAGGQLRVLSLDELDEAFNAGQIDEKTFVLAPGCSEWTRLGDLAGLDEPAAHQAAPPANAHAHAHVQQAPVYAPAPVSVASPLSVIPPTTFSVAPPATTARPLALDLDALDLDIPDDALRPKRGGVKFLAFALVAMIASAGFYAFKHMPMSDAAATAAAAAAAVPATPPAPLAAAPTPTFTPPSTPAPIDARPQLTDEQKKALAQKDKSFASKQAATKAAKAAAAPHHHHGGKHSKEKVFHNGGSAYDPLNGSL